MSMVLDEINEGLILHDILCDCIHLDNLLLHLSPELSLTSPKKNKPM